MPPLFESEARSRQMSPWRHRLHEIIFEADTRAGKTFDVALLIAIVGSVAVVMLESVADVRARWGPWLVAAEWAFTLLFTAEYVLRLVCVDRPARYATSFFGVVDLLAIIPTYLSLLLAGTQALIVVRALRLLRLFRIFKLSQHLVEARLLLIALRRTRAKIMVFLVVVLTVMLIMGAAMYVVEGPERGFTSIPTGVYWAIVTMTTVGYGDIAPQTVLGRTLAALAMIMGYSIIVVPTGLFSAEVLRARQDYISTQACPSCGRDGHDEDAVYCKFCSAKL